MLIAPSMIAADFSRLAEETRQICKTDCDYLHLDIMDGHFVPNLTFGPLGIEAIAKEATKPLDIHLMVSNNDFFVDLVAPFKPAFVSFHLESETHCHRLIQKIRHYNISPGIAINPHTNPQLLHYLLPFVDLVLIMSVNPGFGGQEFIEHTLAKISHLKEMIKQLNLACLIEVDGGINDKNITAIKQSGADIAVSGSYIFCGDYQAKVQSLKI